MAFQPIIQARYVSLHLPNQLSNFIYGYFKHLPRFNGETGLSTEYHLAVFLDFADNMNIEHEDVYMRLFVQYLELNIMIWFRQLRADSIHSWNELTTIFNHHWRVKKDPIYYLTKFEEVKETMVNQWNISLKGLINFTISCPLNVNF